MQMTTTKRPSVARLLLMASAYKTQLGQRIASRRKFLDLSQPELASILGVTPQTISRWERGEHLPMKGGQMDRLITALEISPEELLAGLKPERKGTGLVSTSADRLERLEESVGRMEEKLDQLLGSEPTPEFEGGLVSEVREALRPIERMTEERMRREAQEIAEPHRQAKRATGGK